MSKSKSQGFDPPRRLGSSAATKAADRATAQAKAAGKSDEEARVAGDAAAFNVLMTGDR